ncbi:MAG: ABC transporter permease, partial [Chitinophagia bacterium]|nr:ABC transporter permease [Chitinophagia bacterium]
MTDIKSAPQNDVWDIEIDANKRGINIDLGELWRYRDLFQLFVRRDIVTVYKQTILGPIWYFIQPIFTSIIFWILFGKVAGLTSDSIPSFPFYLISINLWSYFSDILTVSSKTFTDNVSVFGKVYFPRIILPITKVISGMTKFFIQFSLFICFYIYYVFINPQIHPTYFLILAPLILLITVAFSLGLGILITSITTKYRDFYY